MERIAQRFSRALDHYTQSPSSGTGAPRRASVGNTPHAVVVGGGFGGIAAALRLRARGYRVSLYEANEQLGGRASTFESAGFTFDGGPTVITAPYLFDELFELVGRRSQDYFTMVPVDPFYRVIFDDGQHFDYVGEEERILQQIREGYDSRDVDGYRKLADHSRRIFEAGYTHLAHQPFGSWTDMAKAAPAMIRLENYRSVYSLVAKYIRDPKLRQVFTFQPLLIGGNPFSAPSIYLLIHWLERKWGVHFALGGTGAVVAGLARLLDEIGVEVYLDSPVDEILCSDGRKQQGRIRGVRVNGRDIPADVVVCNADPSVVYPRMISQRYRKRFHDRRVARVKQSMSLFVTYFGTDKTYPEIAHHTIALGPRYKGLLTDIFDHRTLADDFSLYLHAPTRTDASLAPPGGESFYVLSPVPNLLGEVDWQVAHDEYQDRILTHLEGRLLPGLSENLATAFSVDPRYFAGRLRSADGAAFGPEPTLTQSAYFRFHNKCPDIEQLYFVGAGTHPGAGVPGVLGSAKVLEELVPALGPGQRLAL